MSAGTTVRLTPEVKVIELPAKCPGTQTRCFLVSLVMKMLCAKHASALCCTMYSRN